LPLASKSLRALNARGLLIARRSGPSVYYSPRPNRSIPDSIRLLQIIRKNLADNKKSSEKIFQYSTAFTHPRRILIVKAIRKKPMRFKEISRKTNIPYRALTRHLRKLIGRGFLRHANGGRYLCSAPQNEFARFLLYLAQKS
jgi:DNA-binding transcriptional ArsR family regulator